MIRELCPEVVFGHDPWKRYRLHPDHRHAGLLACEGIVAARDPHFYREQGLAAHRPKALLLWEADEPDHVEDVGGDPAYPSQARCPRSACQPVREHDDGCRRRSAHRVPQPHRRPAAGLGEPFGYAAAEVFKLITDL